MDDLIDTVSELMNTIEDIYYDVEAEAERRIEEDSTGEYKKRWKQVEALYESGQWYDFLFRVRWEFDIEECASCEEILDIGSRPKTYKRFGTLCCDPISCEFEPVCSEKCAEEYRKNNTRYEE